MKIVISRFTSKSGEKFFPPGCKKGRICTSGAPRRGWQVQKQADLHLEGPGRRVTGAKIGRFAPRGRSERLGIGWGWRGGVSSRAHGKREGPAGDKFPRSGDAGNGGRVRSGAKRNGVPRATPSPSPGTQPITPATSQYLENRANVRTFVPACKVQAKGC